MTVPLRLSIAQLSDLIEAIFLKRGLSQLQAGSVARVIAAGERDACASHGIYRIEGCLRTVEAGKVAPQAEPVLALDDTAIIRVDAREGFSCPAAPGVGVITALSVASVFDDASRFRRSSSAGAYLGWTPRRYESGETSHNGRISKQGNQLTRKHLYEAATSLLTRNLRFSTLKAWGMKLAKTSGFKKARVAVARKLAVILHAMWKTNTPFRWS